VLGRGGGGQAIGSCILLFLPDLLLTLLTQYTHTFIAALPLSSSSSPRFPSSSTALLT
jgi:hypothetical protein